MPAATARRRAPGCADELRHHADRGRPPRRARRAATTTGRSWSTPSARATSSAMFRSRRCISPTIWRRSARCWRALPDLPQVACFDTAFHRGHGAVADHYAMPEHFYAEGVRRYGFHGLSYEYVAASPARSRAGDRGAGASSSPIWAAALRCARCGRPQRREHDGLYGARRLADGHAAGPARSGRRALSDRSRRA